MDTSASTEIGETTIGPGELTTDDDGGYPNYDYYLPPWMTDPIQLFLARYGVIIIGCIGLISNACGFVVLLSREFRKFRSSLMLTVLCCVDTLALLSYMMPHFLGKDKYFDFDGTPGWFCMTLSYLRMLFPYLASWTLVIVCIERTVFVKLPFKAKGICSKRNLLSGWLVVMVIICSIHIPSFWYTHVPTDDELSDDMIPFIGGGCYIQSDWMFYFDYVMPYMDIVMIALAPSVILMTCSILIIIEVYQAQQKRAEMTANNSHFESRDHISITVMLLVTNLSFFLITTPFYAMTISYPFLSFEVQSTSGSRAFSVTEILMISNHAVNIFLYYFTGSSFRSCFKKIFCWQIAGKDKMHAIGHRSATTKSTGLKDSAFSTGSSAAQKEESKHVNADLPSDLGDVYVGAD